jgi:hypothetical protein
VIGPLPRDQASAFVVAHKPLEVASFVALLFGDYIEKSGEGFVEDREESLA